VPDDGIIGGAVYSNCEEPLTSGVQDVQVCVDCGDFQACDFTSDGWGGWSIPGVPSGNCTVTLEKQGWDFCYVTDACPPDPCVHPIDIIVDSEHQAENMTLGFWAYETCKTCDMNYDDMCTMVYDIECFVQCVYYGDCIADADDNCTAPDGADLCCPADGNCDGLCTMVYDVESFVNCIYYGGGCGECAERAGAAVDGTGRDAGLFTIGGAVYDDESNPLFTGVGGTPVDVRGADGSVIASTTTSYLGLWKVDDLPKGTYTVVFRDGDRQHSKTIVVQEESKADNLRIRWARTNDVSRPVQPTARTTGGMGRRSK
jgi:hypothetical protein